MKKVVKFIGVLMLSMMIPVLGFSQQEANKKTVKKERVLAAKKQFFKEKLPLNDSELESFWEVYMEMNEKIKPLRKEKKEVMKSIKENYETLSDADAKSKTKRIFEIDREIIDIRSLYHDKIAKEIGGKKAAKIPVVEMQFKKELLKKIKERREQHQ